MLTTLGPACNAQTLSVWSCKRDRLDLVCDWLGTQRLHNLLFTMWPTVSITLRNGERARLADSVEVLPVCTERDGLLGVLLTVGQFRTGGAARALLDDLARRLAPALRDPWPEPSPHMLRLPLKPLDAPGGLDELHRRFYTALFERHGGVAALVSQALGVPRQTLHGRIERLGIAPEGPAWLARRAPLPLEFEPDALDLERRTCQLVLERCRGDVTLTAIMVGMTPSAWRAYLRALRIKTPPPKRRAVRRRRA